MGSGTHAFEYALRPGVFGSITVQRSIDGAALPFTENAEAMREAAGLPKPVKSVGQEAQPDDLAAA